MKSQSFFTKFSLCAQPIHQDEKEESHQKILQSQIIISKNGTLVDDLNQSIILSKTTTQQEYEEFILEIYNQIQQDTSPDKPSSEIYSIDRRFYHEETKQTNNECQLTHIGDGLLIRITESIYENQHQQNKDSYQSFIMKVLQNNCDEFKLNPRQEVGFVKQLMPQIIPIHTAQRAKQDIILIAHDPTGSLLMKHLTMSQAIYYLEDSKLYSQILDKAISILNLRHKIYKVFKSEIIEKVDTAIINLLYHPEISLSGVIREYLSLAHDIIVVISPHYQYDELQAEFRIAIKQSQQQNIHCSIEIQNIYLNNKLIARIVYYGDVSKITQNQQLNYLYKCLSKLTKVSYKYKQILKEIRNQIGIMKLIDLFAEYNLIQDQSEAQFLKFYRHVRINYLSKIKSSKLIVANAYVDSSVKSSTESEDEEDTQISFVKQSRMSNYLGDRQLLCSHRGNQRDLAKSQQIQLNFNKFQ